jgi:hypothetical protein
MKRTMEKYYLITKEELLKIGASDATAMEIMEVQANVLTRPYTEPSALSVIARASVKGIVIVGRLIVKGLTLFASGLIHLADDLTKPEPKKGGKKE